MSDTTILLVDDDAVLSQVLRRVLTRQGYRVIEAGTVAEALTLARSENPALGLVDLCLPDGDGVELARGLEQEGHPLPLILMTAYPLRLRDQPELGEGFARVLTKPLNLEELRHTIEQVLTGTVAPAPASSATGMVAPRPPATEKPGAPVRETPTPPEPTPAKRRSGLIAALTAAVVLGAGFFAWLAAGKPSLSSWFTKKPEATVATPSDGRQLVPGDRNSLELPQKVLDTLGVEFAVVSEKAIERPLVLAGSLSFDPTRLYRIQSRFGGEVIELGTTPDRDTEGRSIDRRLRTGDRVTRGKVLAVVLSKDLGEKKSELVDALVKLQVDEDNLAKIKDLYERGITPEVVYRQQVALVATDRNAAARAELTLLTWQLSEEEIAVVKAEAKRVGTLKEGRNLVKETLWAKVEVKAPADGVIVEMNVNLHNIVDTTFDLYKVADLRKLGVLLQAYEEDLRLLQPLPEHYPWELHVSAEPRRESLENDGIERIGVVIDPSQHTAPVLGRVDNTWHKVTDRSLDLLRKDEVPEKVLSKLRPLREMDFVPHKQFLEALGKVLDPEDRARWGKLVEERAEKNDGNLHVGQFITAKVELPAPPNVVSVPAAALYEDGETSAVFIQANKERPTVLTLRRVIVAARMGDFVYLVKDPSAAEKARGLQGIEPGMRVVVASVVQLKATLEELQQSKGSEK
jgi:cobalt-zinc-cadmium efflux system membrane fusion protein